MKKTITVVVLIIFSAGLINAQTFSFGARSTPMLSWSKVVSTDDFDFTNDGVKPGFSIGPSLKTNLSDNFNIEVGALFSWQGNKFNQKNDTLDYHYDIKRQYLHIPVTANGNIPLHRYFDAVMTFGVMPSIQLSSIADITDNNNSGEDIKVNYDMPGSYGNFYLIAGAGALIHLTREVDFAIGAKYNHGTIDAWFDRERNTYIKELTEKHHFVSVDLGLYIKF